MTALLTRITSLILFLSLLGNSQVVAQDVVFDYPVAVNVKTGCGQAQADVRVSGTGSVYGYNGETVYFTMNVGGQTQSWTAVPQQSGGKWVFTYYRTFQLSPGTYSGDIHGVVNGLNTTAAFTANVVIPNCAFPRVKLYIDQDSDCNFTSASEILVPETAIPIKVNGFPLIISNSDTLELNEGDTIQTIYFEKQSGGVFHRYFPSCTTKVNADGTMSVDFAYTTSDSTPPAPPVIVEVSNTGIIYANPCGSTSSVLFNGNGKLKNYSGTDSVSIAINIGTYSATKTVATISSGTDRSFSYDVVLNMAAGSFSGTVTATLNPLSHSSDSITVDFGPSKCTTISGSLYVDRDGDCIYDIDSEKLAQGDSLPLYIGSQIYWVKENFMAKMNSSSPVFVSAVKYTLKKGALYRTYTPICTPEVVVKTTGTYNFAYSVKDSTANTTSIQSPSTEEFNIWPNPAEDHLNIKLGTDSKITYITITDLVGKTKWSGSISGDLVVDLKAFTPGLYMVSLQGNEVRFTRKLVVK